VIQGNARQAAPRTYEQRRERQGAHHSRKCMPSIVSDTARRRVQSMNGAPAPSATASARASALGSPNSPQAQGHCFALPAVALAGTRPASRSRAACPEDSIEQDTLGLHSLQKNQWMRGPRLQIFFGSKCGAIRVPLMGPYEQHLSCKLWAALGADERAMDHIVQRVQRLFLRILEYAALVIHWTASLFLPLVWMRTVSADGPRLALKNPFFFYGGRVHPLIWISRLQCSGKETITK
jgi:hypothetical protein